MTEVIAALNLSRRYGETWALRDVSFTIAGPQVVGILGPNGAGKTTLLDILEGLARPDGGTVRLFGRPLAPRAYPRRRIGVVLQREFVIDAITVGEYAELFAAIYGVASGREKILAAAGLAGDGKPAGKPDRSHLQLARLSGGEAQRLYIAAAVSHRPDLLFLDEPTAQLDPEHKREVGDLVRELGKEHTVVLTTHDLREAEAVCDHVLFLVEGEVRAQGPRAELIASVPAEARRGRGLEDAFFHFCAARITARGDLEGASS